MIGGVWNDNIHECKCKLEWAGRVLTWSTVGHELIQLALRG